jgi:hypothetical protein
MTTIAPPEHLNCHIARGCDLTRCGLVLDYRGDVPPVELFEVLRAAGWATPVLAGPPPGAIDWSRPDAATGRRWSAKPYLVVGAMAVPGATTRPEHATREWLRSVLEAFGIELDPRESHVGVLRDVEPGVAEVLRTADDDVATRDISRRAHMADVFAATPSIANTPGAPAVAAPPAPAPAAPAAAVAAPATDVVDVRTPEPTVDLTVPAEPVPTTVVSLQRFRARATRRTAPVAAPVDDGTAPLVWRGPIATAQ